MNEILHKKLIELAKAQRTTTYGEVAPLVGLDMQNKIDRSKISTLLAEIAKYENNKGRPMLPSIVVRKGNNNIPGDGFFVIAEKFGLFNGNTDDLAKRVFWKEQLTATHNHWKHKI